MFNFTCAFTCLVILIVSLVDFFENLLVCLKKSLSMEDYEIDAFVLLFNQARTSSVLKNFRGSKVQSQNQAQNWISRVNKGSKKYFWSLNRFYSPFTWTFFYRYKQWDAVIEINCLPLLLLHFNGNVHFSRLSYFCPSVCKGL